MAEGAFLPLQGLVDAWANLLDGPATFYPEDLFLVNGLHGQSLLIKSSNGSIFDFDQYLPLLEVFRGLLLSGQLELTPLISDLLRLEFVLCFHLVKVDSLI